MCFHNSLTASPAELLKRYGVTKGEKIATFEPIYHANAFAYMLWPVLTAQRPDTFQLMAWGLVPRWARSLDEACDLRSQTLNAKVETLAEKPSFKHALQQSQRCIIPSSGFFEWRTVGKKKIPYFICLKDAPIFSMAGLWETWVNPEQADERWHTFSIVTTEANALMATIHNTKRRMPLILTPENESIWLKINISDEEMAAILTPLPDELLVAHTIGGQINNKNGQSNIPEVTKFVHYSELDHQ
jgi:putative SOS response-associated peptidase YedK